MFISILDINKPSIKPIVLCMTSSNCAMPLYNRYWDVSINKEKIIPAIKIVHFFLLGNNSETRKPNGKNSIIFNIMSHRLTPGTLFITALYVQKGINCILENMIFGRGGRKTIVEQITTNRYSINAIHCTILHLFLIFENRKTKRIMINTINSVEYKYFGGIPKRNMLLNSLPKTIAILLYTTIFDLIQPINILSYIKPDILVFFYFSAIFLCQKTIPIY